ncbi:ethanolamine ammonia-lyase subunit EutB, partial [Clostridioides difficile]|uniref:ethanolamine ammonia-lyase subunit EutB n=1 Tax=Clostridioides difficile TaxID=1496 RepID=UPI001EEE6009
PDGILASLLEGLTFGIGDAVLGLNPVDDSVESVTKVLKRFEEDEVTRIIQDAVNEKVYEEIKNWTVSELREWLLDSNTTSLD